MIGLIKLVIHLLLIFKRDSDRGHDSSHVIMKS